MKGITDLPQMYWVIFNTTAKL